MENELIIAQWLMDNSAFLLSEYETIKEEIDEYMYLKAMAHQQFAIMMNKEEFEIAFGGEKIQKIIDFWFRRENDETDSIH